jgi:6-phosphogluconolactonase (cycloisomerase 2 family)
MKKQNLIAILGLFALFIGAFSTGLVIAPANAQGVVGSVYIMSNSASGNQVIVYSRAADGTLTWKASYSTNGLGITGLTGSNQGGLVISEDGRWLIVVNAGSNDVSVFSINHKGLTLTDKASSEGTKMPISVTVHGNVVYVLNSGGTENTGNIAGFDLNDGNLFAISGSVQPLSGITAPAQISFNPSGTVLVVTEKSTSKIDTFLVNNEGVASGPNVQSSSGGTPFGFDFTPSGTLVVSEAAGGPSGTSAVSSYSISDTGSLTTPSPSVPDTQLAACWLVVTGNGQFAYTANAHSTTVSSYTIGSNGKISLLNAKAATVGGTDLDMALARSSRFLYVFDNGDHAIVAYEVHADVSLTWLQTTSGIPAGADGLSAN